MTTEHHRRSIRLPNYDYSLAGAYFLTIVTHNRQTILGDIHGDTVCLTNAGNIVEQAWQKLPMRYPVMESAAYVTMPNHVHGIIVIHETASHRVPLAEIVRAFKTFTARRVNLLRNTPNQPVWQRNYYEHIIRNDEDLDRIYQYILDNPRRWAEDEENPHGSRFL